MCVKFNTSTENWILELFLNSSYKHRQQLIGPIKKKTLELSFAQSEITSLFCLLSKRQIHVAGTTRWQVWQLSKPRGDTLQGHRRKSKESYSKTNTSIKLQNEPPYGARTFFASKTPLFPGPCGECTRVPYCRRRHGVTSWMRSVGPSWCAAQTGVFSVRFGVPPIVVCSTRLSGTQQENS